MAEPLIIRGGTVVTADGRRQADVAVESGRIRAIEERLPQNADALEVDASGLLVLPGVIDVHTHTRVASDAEPDRFFQDSIAAAFGGTTTFLAFNNPGTGSELTGALPTDVAAWRRQTDSDSAIDYGLSLVVTGQHADAAAQLPAAIDAGVPTAKAFMVYDFAVSDAQLRDSLAAAAHHGGMLEVHCEDRVTLEANTARLLAEGHSAPRYHAASRPPVVEAMATRRAIKMAAAADAQLYIVHLSSEAALDEVRRARATGQPVFAETCPHFLALDESRYDLPDADAARFIISPPLRSPQDRAALWSGLADGALSLVASDHVPDRVDNEKRLHGQSFDQISNGVPGIETVLAIVYSEGVARGHISIERMVDLLSTTPARLFGLGNKGAIEVGRDADVVLFDPTEKRTLRAAELHHTSDYSPYEGMALGGVVRSTLVRGEFVVREGHFVGRRGYGKFQERELRI